jgi:hypothetical protein
MNLNIFLLLVHSVNTVGIVAQLGDARFAKLELTRSVRELVTLFGARANSAHHEWVQHVAPFKAAGATDAQRAALESGHTSTRRSSILRNLLVATESVQYCAVSNPSAPYTLSSRSQRKQQLGGLTCALTFTRRLSSRSSLCFLR